MLLPVAVVALVDLFSPVPDPAYIPNPNSGLYSTSLIEGAFSQAVSGERAEQIRREAFDLALGLGGEAATAPVAGPAGIVTGFAVEGLSAAIGSNEDAYEGVQQLFQDAYWMASEYGASKMSFHLFSQVEGGLQSEGASEGYLGIVLYDAGGNELATVNAVSPFVGTSLEDYKDGYGWKLKMDNALFQRLLAWLQEQQQLQEGWMEDWWTRYSQQNAGN